MDTTTLIGIFRGLMPHDTFLLNLLFPNVVTFESRDIAFDKLFDDHTLAPFVSPLVAGKANTMEGQVLEKFSPAYVKPKDVIDPERVLKRQAGEMIGGNLSTEQRRDAILVDIFDSQRKRILNVIEWMAWQLVLEGEITVEGENYKTSVVDFGRAAENTVELLSDARWDQSEADPVGDLEDWLSRLDAPGTHILFGQKAFRLAAADSKFEKLFDSRRGSDTKLELAPAEMFASYRGRFGGGGPELWTYTGWYRDKAGNKVKYLPDNAVTIVSTGATGVRAHGAILDGRAGYRAMEMFPKVWQEEDPPVEFAMTQSAPLPVLPLINSTLTARVFTP